MAKFYVQSGNFQTIISADDAEKAALWTVHCAMRQILPVYEDEELTPSNKGELTVVEGLRVLGNAVHVSEIGFDRDDCIALDTFELVVHWHQLMIALARLEAMMK